MIVETLVSAHWGFGPAAALAAIGLVLMARGLWFGVAGSRGLVRERDALRGMRGFRLAVVGLCLVGFAAAWAWQALWLFVVAAGVLGEELLETSVIIEVLKRHPAPNAAHAGRAAIVATAP